MNKEEHPNIHTYIGNRWAVSTIWRQCSSLESDHWYYETHVWTLNEDRTLANLLYTSSNLEGHHRAIRALVHNGEEGLKELYIYD